MHGLRQKMTKYRKAQGMTLRQMAKVCQCSAKLLAEIEYGGWITHPKIAARIAAAYQMDVTGYNNLVAEEHKADKLPKPKQKPKPCNLDQTMRAFKME